MNDYAAFYRQIADMEREASRGNRRSRRAGVPPSAWESVQDIPADQIVDEQMALDRARVRAGEVSRREQPYEGIGFFDPTVAAIRNTTDAAADQISPGMRPGEEQRRLDRREYWGEAARGTRRFASGVANWLNEHALDDRSVYDTFDTERPQAERDANATRADSLAAADGVGVDEGITVEAPYWPTRLERLRTGADDMLWTGLANARDDSTQNRVIASDMAQYWRSEGDEEKAQMWERAAEDSAAMHLLLTGTGAAELIPGWGAVPALANAGRGTLRLGYRALGQEVPQILRAPVREASTDAAMPMTANAQGWRNNFLLGGGTYLAADAADGNIGDDPGTALMTAGGVMAMGRRFIPNIDSAIPEETRALMRQGEMSSDGARNYTPRPRQRLTVDPEGRVAMDYEGSFNTGDGASVGETRSVMRGAREALDRDIADTRRSEYSWTPNDERQAALYRREFERDTPTNYAFSETPQGEMRLRRLGAQFEPDPIQAQRVPDDAPYAFEGAPQSPRIIDAEATPAPARRFQAAVRDPETGQVYTGQDHLEAIDNAPEGVRQRLEAAYDAPGEDPSIIGFEVDGQFMGREEGLQALRSQRRPVRIGENVDTRRNGTGAIRSNAEDPLNLESGRLPSDDEWFNNLAGMPTTPRMNIVPEGGVPGRSAEDMLRTRRLGDAPDAGSAGAGRGDLFPESAPGPVRVFHGTTQDFAPDQVRPWSHFGTENAARQRLEALVDPEFRDEAPMRVLPYEITGRRIDVGDEFTTPGMETSPTDIADMLLRGRHITPEEHAWAMEPRRLGSRFEGRDADEVVFERLSDLAERHDIGAIGYRNEIEDAGSRSYIVPNPRNVRPALPDGSAAQGGNRIPSIMRVEIQQPPGQTGSRYRLELDSQKNGFITVTDDGDVWVVNNSHLDPDLRGQGHGVRLYEDLVLRAREAGARALRSDHSVSADAQNAWRGLQRRGYSVRQIDGPDGPQFEVDLTRIQRAPSAPNAGQAANSTDPLADLPPFLAPNPAVDDALARFRENEEGFRRALNNGAPPRNEAVSGRRLGAESRSEVNGSAGAQGVTEQGTEGVPGPRYENGRLSDAILDQIEAAVERGESLSHADIARELGTTQKAVTQALTDIRRGVRRPDLRTRVEAADDLLGDLRSNSSVTVDHPMTPQIAELAARGDMGASDIGREIGLTEWQVRHIAERNNIELPNARRFSDHEDRNSAWLADHENGMSFRAIARRDNIGVGAVASGIKLARAARESGAPAVETASAAAGTAARTGVPEERVRGISAARRRNDPIDAIAPILATGAAATALWGDDANAEDVFNPTLRNEIQRQNEGEPEAPRPPMAMRLGGAIGTGLIARRFAGRIGARGVAQELPGALAAGVVDLGLGGDPEEAALAALANPAVRYVGEEGGRRLGQALDGYFDGEARRSLNWTPRDYDLNATPAHEQRVRDFAMSLPGETTRVRGMTGENYGGQILREEEGLPPVSVGDKEIAEQGYSTNRPGTAEISPRDEFLAMTPSRQEDWMDRQHFRMDWLPEGTPERVAQGRNVQARALEAPQPPPPPPPRGMPPMNRQTRGERTAANVQRRAGTRPAGQTLDGFIDAAGREGVTIQPQGKSVAARARAVADAIRNNPRLEQLARDWGLAVLLTAGGVAALSADDAEASDGGDSARYDTNGLASAALGASALATGAVVANAVRNPTRMRLGEASRLSELPMDIPTRRFDLNRSRLGRAAPRRVESDVDPRAVAGGTALAAGPIAWGAAELMDPYATSPQEEETRFTRDVMPYAELRQQALELHSQGYTSREIRDINPELADEMLLLERGGSEGARRLEPASRAPTVPY